jgi:DNA-binding LacI/PurR family transcriptional regulator
MTTFSSDPNELTISDVANAAGVSVSTVSRILNGKQDVAKATRVRVQKVIEELGYMPHAQAQRLRAGRTRNIAFVFPVRGYGSLPYNPLQTAFIVGAAQAAGDKEYYFTLHTRPLTKRTLLSLYQSAQVDGLVLMEIHTNDWRVDLLRQRAYPFVMIGHTNDNTGLSYIDLDFEAATILAFEHLVQLGHTKIGFLAISAQRRHQGFGPAVHAWSGYEKAQATYPMTSIYREVDTVAQEAHEATLALLDEMPDLTAIVSSHDVTTVGILRALNARGRRVPDTCSVITLLPESIVEFSMPSLTAIDFPSYKMGYQAVDMLIRTLEGQLTEPEQILIPPRLVIRESTAPVT